MSRSEHKPLDIQLIDRLSCGVSSPRVLPILSFTCNEKLGFYGSSNGVIVCFNHFSHEEDGDWGREIQLETQHDITCMSLHPRFDFLLVGDASGRVMLYCDEGSRLVDTFVFQEVSKIEKLIFLSFEKKDYKFLVFGNGTLIRVTKGFFRNKKELIRMVETDTVRQIHFFDRFTIFVSDLKIFFINEQKERREQRLKTKTNLEYRVFKSVALESEGKYYLSHGSGVFILNPYSTVESELKVNYVHVPGICMGIWNGQIKGIRDDALLILYVTSAELLHHIEQKSHGVDDKALDETIKDEKCVLAERLISRRQDDGSIDLRTHGEDGFIIQLMLVNKNTLTSTQDISFPEEARGCFRAVDGLQDVLFVTGPRRIVFWNSFSLPDQVESHIKKLDPIDSMVFVSVARHKYPEIRLENHIKLIKMVVDRSVLVLQGLQKSSMLERSAAIGKILASCDNVAVMHHLDDTRCVAYSQLLLASLKDFLRKTIDVYNDNSQDQRIRKIVGEVVDCFLDVAHASINVACELWNFSLNTEQVSITKYFVSHCSPFLNYIYTQLPIEEFYSKFMQFFKSIDIDFYSLEMKAGCASWIERIKTDGNIDCVFQSDEICENDSFLRQQLFLVLNKDQRTDMIRSLIDREDTLENAELLHKVMLKILKEELFDVSVLATCLEHKKARLQNVLHHDERVSLLYTQILWKFWRFTDDLPKAFHQAVELKHEDVFEVMVTPNGEIHEGIASIITRSHYHLYTLLTIDIDETVNKVIKHIEMFNAVELVRGLITPAKDAVTRIEELSMELQLDRKTVSLRRLLVDSMVHDDRQSNLKRIVPVEDYNFNPLLEKFFFRITRELFASDPIQYAPLNFLLVSLIIKYDAPFITEFLNNVCDFDQVLLESPLLEMIDRCSGDEERITVYLNALLRVYIFCGRFKEGLNLILRSFTFENKQLDKNIYGDPVECIISNAIFFIHKNHLGNLYKSLYQFTLAKYKEQGDHSYIAAVLKMLPRFAIHDQFAIFLSMVPNEVSFPELPLLLANMLLETGSMHSMFSDTLIMFNNNIKAKEGNVRRLRNSGLLIDGFSLAETQCANCELELTVPQMRVEGSILAHTSLAINPVSGEICHVSQPVQLAHGAKVPRGCFGNITELVSK
ncbi:hypothetical protein PCE1_002048 [Barthelona sp. PCE]